MNSTRPSVVKKPWKQALEDAVVVGLTSFLGGMIATGARYPPEGEIVYGSLLAALFAGTFAYAQGRRIQVRR